MRIQDIEIILAIRDHCSFSRAADSLSLSQPAVSLAVKRTEEKLSIRIFDRSGPVITLTPKGERVVRGFDRMVEILDGIKKQRGEIDTVHVGVSPLVSGADVARTLGRYFQARASSFAVEFLESEEIGARGDFDVKVVLPGIHSRATAFVNLPTQWIGVANGVFIRSRQEADVWERAMHVLVDHRVPVAKVVEVNNCGQAYHMAASGAGFTPCVMTRESGFRTTVNPALPPLAPIRLDIFADGEISELLRASLAVCPGKQAS